MPSPWQSCAGQTSHFPHFIKCGKCSSFADTKDQFEWAYARQRLYTAPYTIKEFVEELDAEKPEFKVKPG